MRLARNIYIFGGSAAPHMAERYNDVETRALPELPHDIICGSAASFQGKILIVSSGFGSHNGKVLALETKWENYVYTDFEVSIPFPHRAKLLT
jgi:hypothetical protein